MNQFEKSPNSNIDRTYENHTELKKILESAKEKLYQRLQELKNVYHNLQHAQEVSETLQIFLNHLAESSRFNEKEKLLLLECALRHDDGHSGATYRQDVVDGDELSNEEHAFELLKQDLGNKLSAGDIKFMKDHILATSFGQNNKEALPEDKKSDRKRN